MKKSKSQQGIALLPILIVAGIILVGILTIPKVLQKTSNTAEPASEQVSVPPESDTWETYQSSQYGYSVKHPKGWIVDDSQFATKQEISIYEPSKNAGVQINAYQDNSVNSAASMKDSMQAFKEKMSSEPNLKVAKFTDNVEGNIGGFIATGEQIINGETYIFENRGLLATNGRILIFHGNIKVDKKQEYTDTISKIMESFSLDKN
ncbi:hypothetical protein HYW55_03845 [Candidatus Gottesmanbacteria bacterium]|nr:hypothetical protein [Candidatus Gottesmanbacteria bacterium]